MTKQRENLWERQSVVYRMALLMLVADIGVAGLVIYLLRSVTPVVVAFAVISLCSLLLARRVDNQFRSAARAVSKFRDNVRSPPPPPAPGRNI